MAEVLTRDLARRRGLHVAVISRGLDVDPFDEVPEVNAAILMTNRGFNVTAHRARALVPADVTHADLLLTMTLKHLEKIVGVHPLAAGKAFTLAQFAAGAADDIPDAWGKPMADYRVVLKQLDLYLPLALAKAVVRAISAAFQAKGMATLGPNEDVERGAIVSRGSLAAEDGQVGQVAYAAAKAAIKGMTRVIARDLSKEGLQINTILPGIIATPPMMGMTDRTPVVYENFAKSVPFPRRLGHPHEYADLVVTMLGNSYFNGETVRLDGAIRMPPR